MTERQAWLLLARSAQADLDDDLCDVGLCYYLRQTSLDAEVYSSMRARIQQQIWRSKGGYGFFAWPLTPAGHRQRIVFCKRQVARIDRARRKR